MIIKVSRMKSDKQNKRLEEKGKKVKNKDV